MVNEIIPIIYWAGFHPRKKSPKQPVVYPKWKLDSPKKPYICTNRLGLGFFFSIRKKNPQKISRGALAFALTLGGALGAPGCCWMDFLGVFFVGWNFPPCDII